MGPKKWQMEGQRQERQRDHNNLDIIPKSRLNGLYFYNLKMSELISVSPKSWMMSLPFHSLIIACSEMEEINWIPICSRHKDWFDIKTFSFFNPSSAKTPSEYFVQEPPRVAHPGWPTLQLSPRSTLVLSCWLSYRVLSPATLDLLCLTRTTSLLPAYRTN